MTEADTPENDYGLLEDLALFVSDEDLQRAKR